MNKANQITVCGRTIQHDRSGGQGHSWADAADAPQNIIEEIAAEIIDGGRDECDDFLASNGQHYRWA